MTAAVGEVRKGWWIAGTVIRIVLLLMLLWGALAIALSLTPSPRTMDEFHAAVSAGRVSAVVYKEDSGNVSSLKWSEGPLIWHGIDTLPVCENGRAYTVERFRNETRATVPRVTLEEPQGGGRGGILPGWPFRTPAQSDVRWVALAWALTFLIMLGSTPRLGNRWAWFWMFTLGQIGAILFLLLEPRPLWYRHGRLPKPRERLSGGMGCLTSVALSFAAMAAAVAVGELAGGLLG
ncbi:hypothetical protein [Streptosporangium sp. NPDC006007]|uniref:hypothetical protein n=1 Tax=Streptosporangium sp. NPDC006007 TaxID=3154575 RepID=UPI0033A8601B